MTMITLFPLSLGSVYKCIFTNSYQNHSALSWTKSTMKNDDRKYRVSNMAKGKRKKSQFSCTHHLEVTESSKQRNLISVTVIGINI